MKVYTLSGSPPIPALGGGPGTEQTSWQGVKDERTHPAEADLTPRFAAERC